VKDYERIEVRSRAEWRAWLKANHRRRESVWLVSFKKHHPDYLDYDAIVEEALCYGWIDSLPRKLDADRTMLLLSPRKAGSPWSRLNKERVAKLVKARKMRSPGRAKIEAAKVDGSWTVLDDVEDLIVPEDLTTALDANPSARAAFDGFPPSSKKGLLWWVKSAKTASTRDHRVAETVRLAALGLRANHPEAKEHRRKAPK